MASTIGLRGLANRPTINGLRMEGELTHEDDAGHGEVVHELEVIRLHPRPPNGNVLRQR